MKKNPHIKRTMHFQPVFVVQESVVGVYMLVCLTKFYKSTQQSVIRAYIWEVRLEMPEDEEGRTMYYKYLKSQIKLNFYLKLRN